MFENLPKLNLDWGNPITAANFADDGWGPEFVGPYPTLSKRFELNDGTPCSLEMREGKVYLKRAWK